MSFWHTDAHCPPRLHAMSAEQWKQHVDSNHAHYRKDCATCVMSRGVGRQHRRVHHPEAYVLTADVAGPLSPGLDPTSKGTLGKNLRYLMVAKYLVPKQFVEEFSGRPPPSDDGVGPSSTVSPLSEEQQKDLKELFGEEDVAEVENQLPIVEVIDGPAYEEEHREIDPDEVAEYEPSEVENADEETKDQPPSTADVTMPQGDCVHPEFTYLTFAAALPNNQSSTVKGRSRMWCCIYRCMGYLSTDSTLIVGSSTTTDSEIGYGSRECMQRGRNPAYHKKMDMQSPRLGGSKTERGRC